MLDEPMVIRVHGVHDMATADALWAELSLALRSSGAELALDLSEVEFMDASTVAALVRARRDRPLTIRSPSTSARRVLDVCRLDDLLEGAGLSSRPR